MARVTERVAEIVAVEAVAAATTGAELVGMTAVVETVQHLLPPDPRTD